MYSTEAERYSVPACARLTQLPMGISYLRSQGCTTRNMAT